MKFVFAVKNAVLDNVFYQHRLKRIHDTLKGGGVILRFEGWLKKPFQEQRFVRPVRSACVA